MVRIMSCKRCGLCCKSLPNWKDLPDIERAMIRAYDKDAESVFINVKNCICPNLKISNGKATCMIYENRYKFCRAYKCWN